MGKIKKRISGVKNKLRKIGSKVYKATHKKTKPKTKVTVNKKRTLDKMKNVVPRTKKKKLTSKERTLAKMKNVVPRTKKKKFKDVGKGVTYTGKSADTMKKYRAEEKAANTKAKRAKRKF